MLICFGLLNLNQVFVNEFYVNASIVGRVIMGAGFMRGGLCPGTGLSALSIGKIDAMVFFAGGLTGAFFFAAVVMFRIAEAAEKKLHAQI